MLQTQQFDIIRKTDRDLEIPVLTDFLHRIDGNVDTALDIGANYSFGYYANEIRKIAKSYHGLDMLADPQTEKIVDKYILADATLYNFDSYDLITCMSTLEHVGQYPAVYQNYKYKQFELFKKIVDSAKKYAWISVPVGLDYQAEGEMAIINETLLDMFLGYIQKYKTEVGFYFTEGAQAGQPWRPSIREKCVNQAYNIGLGTQALCVMEITK